LDTGARIKDPLPVPGRVPGPPDESPVRQRLRLPGWIVIVRSDVGGVRERLEDAWAVLPSTAAAGRKSTVFAVFDGLGGEPNGQEAAWAAADNLGEALGRATRPDQVLPRLNAWVRQTQGSTTAVVALFPHEGGDGTLLSVGDSAAYALDGTGLDLLTPKDAAGPNVVTDCLGSPDPGGHERSVHVARGQTVLLCTDGIDGVVDPASITAVLQAPDLAAAVEDLFAEVWAKGAPDNATLVAARRVS
jgi:PPM family protein phosphatase